MRALLLWLLAFSAALLPEAVSAQAITMRTPTTATSNPANIVFLSNGAVDTTLSGAATPGLPGGIAIGDLLICVVESRDNIAPTMTAATGTWTQLNSVNNGANSRASLFWSRVVAGQSAPTVNHAGGNVILARIIAFRNVDTTTAFDVANSFTASASDLTVEAGAITTVTDSTLQVFTAHIADNWTGLGAPVGSTLTWTQRFFSATGTGNDAAISVSTALQPAVGLQPALQATSTGGAAAVSHGAQLALRQAAPAATLTINVPAGTAENDVMIAIIAVKPSSATITPPGGGTWTLIRNTPNANDTTETLAVYRRTAGASEPASYDWGISTSRGATGTILSFVNVDTTTPIDAEDAQITASALTHATPSLSTTVPDTLVVTAHSMMSATTWAPPGTMAEEIDIMSKGAPSPAGVSLEVSTVIQATAAMVGPFTATAAGNADRGVTQILALRPRVHHFAISVTNSPDTCTAATLTITAQDASNNTVTNYTGTMNLGTSTSHGTWGLGSAPVPSGTLTDSTPDDGVATYAFAAADNGVVRLTLANARDDDLTVTAVDSTRASTSATSGTIQFHGNFFQIANDALQIAGKGQAMSATLKQGSLCPNDLTGYAGARNLKVWYTADTDHPVGATAPSITGMIGPPLGTGAPGANNLALTFTLGVANFTLTTSDVGKYVINMRDDSGTFAGNNLNGSSPTITTRPFALAFRGADASTAIQHSSSHTGTFLAKAGAGFTATVAAYLWQAADDINNDGIPDAGADVTGNGLAPRFAWPVTISAGASLPSPGTTGSVTRSGGAASIAQGSFSGGAATISDLEYSEVGNVTLIATASDYLNTAGATVGGATNGHSGLDNLGNYVGRFTPSRFALTPSGASGPALVNRSGIGACADPVTTGTVGAGSNALTVASGNGFATGDTVVVVGAGASGIDLVTTATVAGVNFTLGAVASTAVSGTPVRKIGYSYMGDPVRLAFRLTAQNAFGNKTDNYEGDYAKLDLTSAASFGLGAVSGATDLSTRLDAAIASSGSWSLGVADVTVTTGVKRQNSGSPSDSPDGPYNTVRLGIAPNDNDPTALNGTKLVSFNLDVDSAGGNEHASVGTTAARYGRLRILNAVGSEKIDLRVPVRTEYWSGSGFVTNTLDSCTSLNQNNIALDDYTVNLNPGPNCRTYVNNAPVTLNAGAGSIIFAKPLVTGSLRLTARIGASGSPANYCVDASSAPSAAADAALSSLFGRWNDAVDGDGNGTTAYDDNPSARAGFGVYGAQPRNFIFYRENY